jgi:SRSO17 transposase
LPSHTEASALPGTPPSPVIPEAAPEQDPATVQEIRHEVLICV